MRLVLASGNPGKLREMAALLAPAGVELVAQTALGIAEAEEPHRTFLENALAKARHAAQASGLAAVADDSGLCVDALGGAPGVDSAVWAPVEAVQAVERDRETQRRAQDAANNALLLARMAGLTDAAGRRCAFVSTLVALRHAEDPEPLVAVGRWTARVLVEPRGEGGFGYDPLVWVDELGASVAELAPAQKNAHSHRARAMRALLGLLRERWLGAP